MEENSCGFKYVEGPVINLAQLSAKGYTSITSFNPDTSGSEKWRFMNDGKVEENKE